MKKVQILGTGCKKCQTLRANAEQAAHNAGVEIDLQKVEDIADIVAMGVASTPAIVIDGQVVSTGKLLSAKEIEKLIEAHHA